MSAQVGVGVAGWGAAGRLMAAALERSDRFRLGGVADRDPALREAARRDCGVPIHGRVEDLVAAPGIDVLYVATPTAHHAEAITAGAGAGVDVVCEKPVARTVAEALFAVETAADAGVRLLVGASHSYDAPVRALREVVECGRLGALTSVESSCHTDWHCRPRTSADLDATMGNGLVLRQGAHQFDVLRLVCGGAARSVSGLTFGGSGGAERGFAAHLRFADGIVASAYYHGGGGFDSRLTTWGVGELGTVELEPSPPLADFFALPGSAAAPPVTPTFGRTTATFESGSAVVTATGLLVFDERGVDVVDVTDRPSGWDAVLVELADVLDGAAPVHDGAWAVATLEVCLAVHRSAETGAPMELRHQIALSHE